LRKPLLISNIKAEFLPEHDDESEAEEKSYFQELNRMPIIDFRALKEAWPDGPRKRDWKERITDDTSGAQLIGE